MTRHTIIVADDHPLFRDALVQTISAIIENLEVKHAGSLDEVVQVINDTPDPDLVLFDLKMPGAQGFSGLIYLRSQFPDIPVVVVSASEEPPVIRRVLDLGASGFIPKSASMNDMQQAVRAVLAGEVWVPPDFSAEDDSESEEAVLARRLTSLTPQQMRVLMMLREGLLNKQIAYHLDVSEATIKAHVSAILQKLNVDSRTQAVIVAARVDGGLGE